MTDIVEIVASILLGGLLIGLIIILAVNAGPPEPPDRSACIEARDNIAKWFGEEYELHRLMSAMHGEGDVRGSYFVLLGSGGGSIEGSYKEAIKLHFSFEMSGRHLFGSFPLANTSVVVDNELEIPRIKFSVPGSITCGERWRSRQGRGCYCHRPALDDYKANHSWYLGARAQALYHMDSFLEELVIGITIRTPENLWEPRIEMPLGQGLTR